MYDITKKNKIYIRQSFNDDFFAEYGSGRKIINYTTGDILYFPNKEMIISFIKESYPNDELVIEE